MRAESGGYHREGDSIQITPQMARAIEDCEYRARRDRSRGNPREWCRQAVLSQNGIVTERRYDRGQNYGRQQRSGYYGAGSGVQVERRTVAVRRSGSDIRPASYRDDYESDDRQDFVPSGANSDRNSLEGSAFVGAFLPRQTPTVDRIVGDRNADEYGPDLRDGTNTGDVRVVNAPVTLFLTRNGEDKDVIYKGNNQGHEVIEIDASRIDSETLLCVQVPWDIIAHQKKAAEARVMCTDSIYNYVKNGGGRNQRDPVLVVAIVPGNAGKER